MRYNRRRSSRKKHSSCRRDDCCRSSCDSRCRRRSSCIDNKCGCQNKCGGWGSFPFFPWWMMCCCENPMCNGTIQVTAIGTDNALLQGAVFSLYQGSNLMGTAVSNSMGVATFSNICPGTYTVVEITAPPGYVLNPESQTITVTHGAMVSVVVPHEPLIVMNGSSAVGAFGSYA